MRKKVRSLDENMRPGCPFLRILFLLLIILFSRQSRPPSLRRTALHLAGDPMTEQSGLHHYSYRSNATFPKLQPVWYSWVCCGARGVKALGRGKRASTQQTVHPPGWVVLARYLTTSRWRDISTVPANSPVPRPGLFQCPARVSQGSKNQRWVGKLIL